MSLFTILALVAFIIAALMAFFAIQGVLVVLGVVAVGLACLTLAGHGPNFGSHA